VGPGGEALHVRLSRPPAVHPNRIWGWIPEVGETEKSDGSEEGDAYLEDAWGGWAWDGRERIRLVLRVLNIERVEAARTCSGWSECGCGDISHLAWPRTHVQ
jgi:hypothetical protein